MLSYAFVGEKAYEESNSLDMETDGRIILKLILDKIVMNI
jgi:hypothetical protein